MPKSKEQIKKELDAIRKDYYNKINAMCSIDDGLELMRRDCKKRSAPDALPEYDQVTINALVEYSEFKPGESK